jgi:hypothetical protein
MAAQFKPLAPETDLEPLDRVLEAPVEDPLETLRAVHDEAKETAELANLLGRALYAGLLLPLLVLAAVTLSNPQWMRAAGFSVLVLMGAGALLHAYGKAMRAPFDRTALKSFLTDLDAILLFTGFAWGAGALLILPVDTDPAFTTIFSGGTAALLAMIFRTRQTTLMFAAPVGLLTALAALLRPLERPFVTSALAVAASIFVVGSVALSSWMKERAGSVAVADIRPA